MFSSRHYVPLLKGKEAEYRSIGDLNENAKQGLTPLFEIPPIPWNYVEECQDKSVQEHVAKVHDKLSSSWGSPRPFFLDFNWLNGTDLMDDGSHPLSTVIERCRSKELHPIPVTGLTREALYQIAVRDTLTTENDGICIRLEPDDFGLSTLPNLGERINQLLDVLGADTSRTDLLLDFKTISPDQSSVTQIAIMMLVNTFLPNVLQWRSLTVAATGFPDNLSQFAADSASSTPRTEWNVWSALFGARASLTRLPSYGDYGIASPGLPDIDPRIMRMSANLRYATDSEWLILKGRNVRQFGYEQFNALCRDLVMRSEYRGGGFSWGDRYIRKCADNDEGPGSATTWRRVGTTHHLTLVVEQITNLPWP